MNKGVIEVIMAVVMTITPPIGFSRTASATDKYRCNSCGQKLFNILKRSMAVTLAVSLTVGITPLNIKNNVDNVKKAEAAGTSSVMGSDNYVAQANISVGEKYKFGVYDWIAAEASGNLVVLQSKGVTSGSWPGGSVTSYNYKTQGLYNAIKYAEFGSSGLYLVNISKTGTTSFGSKGSGYYWKALKDAAINYSTFGADNGNAWLGTENNSCAWSIHLDGTVYNDSYKHNSFVVAPAFNLDTTKVSLNGNNIVPKFILSYNVMTNGGNSSNWSQVCEPNTSVDLTDKASEAHKDNWEFAGWNEDIDGKNSLLKSITTTSNKTVYAQFKKDVTASFVDR